MELQYQMLLKIVASIGLAGLLGLFWRLYNVLVAKPEKLRSILQKQGIGGPPPSLLLGNLLEIKKMYNSTTVAPSCGAPTHHNCSHPIYRFIEPWRKKYGQVFMFSIGSTIVLHVDEPEMVREITTCTSLDLGRPFFAARNLGPLLGKGILVSNGNYWSYQRKILAPELYMDKVKGMIKLIQESATTLVDSWNNIIDNQEKIADIKIDQHMRMFSGDVISKACFGSNYAKGEEIFTKLNALQLTLSKMKLAVAIPSLISYLPTKSNREAWALEKEVRGLILKVVKRRHEAGYQKDLLQMLLEGIENSDLSQDARDSLIVDNCKNIYLAGFETTAVSAAWCLMLLAANPEWQERLRAEVLNICKGQIPDVDMVLKMKLLTMVINESLRLYPPVLVLWREALSDIKLKDINIPKGVGIVTFVGKPYTDPEIWGADAYQFNPERFANGVNGACKHPHLYMPFGVGPRVCLGQHLALLEMKILISLILSNFSFSLSPTYIHSPVMHLIVLPEHGINLLVKKL